MVRIRDLEYHDLIRLHETLVPKLLIGLVQWVGGLALPIAFLRRVLMPLQVAVAAESQVFFLGGRIVHQSEGILLDGFDGTPDLVWCGELVFLPETGDTILPQRWETTYIQVGPSFVAGFTSLAFRTQHFHRSLRICHAQIHVDLLGRAEVEFVVCNGAVTDDVVQNDNARCPSPVDAVSC